MKTFFKLTTALLLTLLVSAGLFSASAYAAGETVLSKTTLTPNNKVFYKEKQVSSKLKLEVTITPGEGQVLVDPMKNVKVTFPQGMTFKPNQQICPDSKLNSQSPLASPKTIVDNCSNAVVGTGKATILLARQVAAPLSDPFLVAFNAGKTSSGQPKIKIYGFSKGTGVGILMTGTLKNRVLDIAVPVLSYDSAVANFELEFPGPVIEPEGVGVKTQGKDPNYVQALCASSPLVTESVFQLGTRNPSTGQDTGPTTTKVAPNSVQTCTGLAGKAKLKAVKALGPKTVKNGRKAVYKVTFKNNGTATAKNIVVTSSRGGKTKTGSLAPGKTKTVKVPAKIKGKKGKKIAVKFTVKSGNVKSSIVKKVKIK
jgi:hypothetical protein